LVPTEIKELTDAIVNVDGMDNYKMKIYSEKLKELVKFKNNLTELNVDLNEYFYETKQNNEVIPDMDFPNRINEIDSNSLIIHIKKAQLYKVYNVKNLDDFQNDSNTHFRKAEYGPVHEVVRDEYPQKLIIMVNDDIKDSHLTEIKNNIIDFIKKNDAFAKTTLADVKAFGTNGNTEFILSSVKMANIYEKDKIVDKFIKFLKRLGKNDLADKIQFRTNESVVDGVHFYKLPIAKVSLDNTPYNPIDQLLTTPATNAPIIYNTYIINNNVDNSVTNNLVNNIGTINITSKSSKKTLSTFKQFIKDTKPDWYIENTYIDLSILEKAYRDYFNDNEINTSIISRQLNGVLFTKSRRVNNVNKKLLLAYDAL
jgi:hypothetical protein